MRKIYLLLISLLIVSGLAAIVKSGLADTGANFELGDLVKINGDSAVYLIGKNNQRFVYPNEDVFYSWNSDFSKVQTVSPEVLASYQLAGNVTIKPGTKLVKITSDPKVYAVTRGAKLHQIANEEIARELYGADWAKRVVDIPDYLFTNYVIADWLPVINRTDYPMGTVVKYPNDHNIYLIRNKLLCVNDEEGKQKCVFNSACTDVFFNKLSFYANAYHDQDIVMSNKVYQDCGNSPIRGVGDGYLSVPYIAHPDANQNYLY